MIRHLPRGNNTSTVVFCYQILLLDQFFYCLFNQPAAPKNAFSAKKYVLFLLSDFYPSIKIKRRGNKLI